MGYRRVLMAMMTFIVNQKSISSLALSQIIGGQYRTSYTLIHKIRGILSSDLDNANFEQLSGIVEIDGTHASGCGRKPRKLKKPKPEYKTKVPKKWRIKGEAPLLDSFGIR